MENASDWLNTGVTYMIPKSGHSMEVRNYWPITYFTTMLNTPKRNNIQNNLHSFGRAELTISRAERLSSWK